MLSAKVKEDLWRRCNLPLVAVVALLFGAIVHSPITSIIAFSVLALFILGEIAFMTMLFARRFPNNAEGDRIAPLEARLNIAVPFGFLVCVAWWAAQYLRSDPMGLTLIFWPIVTTIAADIGGYIGGRTFGGPLISPRISKRKTWMGFYSAVCAGGVVGTLFMFFTTDKIGVLYAKDGWVASFAYSPILLLASVLQAYAAMAADLAGSAFKRACGIKDSSPLFGAHGGGLDRFGSHLAAVTVSASIVWQIREIIGS